MSSQSDLVKYIVCEKSVDFSQLSIIFKHVLLDYLDNCTVFPILSVDTVEEFDIAKLLGINLRYDNNYALRVASENGHIDVVRYLIENGVTITHKCIALRHASKGGHKDIVRYLVENGANIHSSSSLKYASEGGHTDVVQYLFERGANIHADNNYALRFASKNGRSDVVKFLIEKGANIHADGDYALRVAGEGGYTDAVQYLLESGAKIHAGDYFALRIARKYLTTERAKSYYSHKYEQIPIYGILLHLVQLDLQVYYRHIFL